MSTASGAHTPKLFWRCLALAAASCTAVFALNLIIRSTTGFAVFWPLNGVLLGLCLMVPTRTAFSYMASFFVGSVVAGAFGGTGIVLAAGMGASNLMELMVAWAPLRMLIKQYKNLGHPQVLTVFTIFGIAFGPFIAGSMAGIIVLLLRGQPFFETLRIWWPSHALGMAVCAPMMVTFRPTAWTAEGLLAPGLLKTALFRALVLILITLTVFFCKATPFLFILLPPLVWLTFGLGFAGAPLGALLVIIISFPLTMRGVGPTNLIPDADMVHKFLILQLFLGLELLVTLPIGMILDHRDRLIRKLRKRETSLLYLSEHDPLTGLLNRRGFEKRFEMPTQETERRGFSMIVLDVDWFKKYNDTYGHPAGDDCLTWLANLIQETASGAGGAAGRLGGGEFGIVLSGSRPEEALALAETLRMRVENSKREHSGSPNGIVTISVGVATRSGKGRDGDRSLLLEADTSLYKAKENGRNQVYMKKGRGVKSSTRPSPR